MSFMKTRISELIQSLNKEMFHVEGLKCEAIIRTDLKYNVYIDGNLVSVLEDAELYYYLLGIEKGLCMSS